VKKKIIFLVGPTAVGKSRIAVSLSKKINSEIISCDSMQVYKSMDIITSKPQAALRKSVTHHLIGMITPGKEYNVSRYYKDTGRKIRDIIKRGKLPLIVGGTGLYMSILADGLFKDSASNKVIRNRLYKQALAKGSLYLHDKLKTVDPEAAVKIHPNDTKRIVRALEVYQATGKPISQLQKQRSGLSKEYDIRIFGLNMEREKLYGKIDDRVEEMFAQGLIREVKRLLKIKLSRTASYAIGINELKGYLDGEYGLAEAKSLIKKNTRQYAKRQMTWFKKDKRVNWIEVKARETPAAVVKRISAELKKG
jgi:tRNA dimethylallyltransferase